MASPARAAGMMQGHVAYNSVSVYDAPSRDDKNAVALHGTFWHNDYGTPHSHGCINLSPQDAKWLYRWTLPVVPLDQRYIYEPGSDTDIQVVEHAQSQANECYARRLNEPHFLMD